MVMHQTYQSPFSWRYGSEHMRQIFSEQHKFELWRRVWVALAQAQHTAGLVSAEELTDLKKHQNDIDIDRILEIEKETNHDVVAAIREYAEKAKFGGGKIHLGATSMDINDNADTMRYHEALGSIEKKIVNLLTIFSSLIAQYASTPCMGYTHLQPAEPTTVGYRMAYYAQDLLMDFDYLQFVRGVMKAKGMKGAVGTAASYTALIKSPQGASEMEQEVMKSLGLHSATISTQVYPRKIDYHILTLLSSISSTLAKFASDLRILQSPSIGEWSEPFGKTQVGSSAMPFKKNPIASEKICSLARYIGTLPAVALENASHSYLERTLDDSANRRIILPEGFLAVDEVLITGEKILTNIVINKERIACNLNQYAPFAASESILLKAVSHGANRQDMHETLREIAMQAWAQVQEGKENPMADLLKKSTAITNHVTVDAISELLDVSTHIGDASKRAMDVVDIINKKTR